MAASLPHFRGNRGPNEGKRTRKPLSSEHRAKLSKAHMGNKRALGHHVSPEVRARMSAKHMGKTLSAEHRAKLSASHFGSQNSQWRDGSSYEPYSPAFGRSLKRNVRERDSHRCQVCGVPQTECTKRLDIHHIDYDKKNSDPVNLISLCVRCHGRTTTNRAYWRETFQHLMISRGLRAAL